MGMTSAGMTSAGTIKAGMTSAGTIKAEMINARISRYIQKIAAV